MLTKAPFANPAQPGTSFHLAASSAVTANATWRPGGHDGQVYALAALLFGGDA